MQGNKNRRASNIQIITDTKMLLQNALRTNQNLDINEIASPILIRPLITPRASDLILQSQNCENDNGQLNTQKIQIEKLGKQLQEMNSRTASPNYISTLNSCFQKIENADSTLMESQDPMLSIQQCFIFDQYKDKSCNIYKYQLLNISQKSKMTLRYYINSLNQYVIQCFLQLLDKSVNNRIKGKEKEMLENMRIRFQAFKNQINFLQKIIASKLYEGEIGRRLQASENEKEVLKNMNEKINTSNSSLRDKIKKLKVQLDIVESDNRFLQNSLKHYITVSRNSNNHSLIKNQGSQEGGQSPSYIKAYDYASNSPKNQNLIIDQLAKDLGSQSFIISPFSPIQNKLLKQKIDEEQRKELNFRLLATDVLENKKYKQYINIENQKISQIQTKSDQITQTDPILNVDLRAKFLSPNRQSRNQLSIQPQKNENQVFQQTIDNDDNYYKNLFMDCSKAVITQLNQNKKLQRKDSSNSLFITESQQELKYQNDQGYLFHMTNLEKQKIIECLFSDERLIKALYDLIFNQSQIKKQNVQTSQKSLNTTHSNSPQHPKVRISIASPSEINQFVNQGVNWSRFTASHNLGIRQHQKSLSFHKLNALKSFNKFDVTQLFKSEISTNAQSLIQTHNKMPEIFSMSKSVSSAQIYQRKDLGSSSMNFNTNGKQEAFQNFKEQQTLGQNQINQENKGGKQDIGQKAKFLHKVSVNMGFPYNQGAKQIKNKYTL